MQPLLLGDCAFVPYLNIYSSSVSSFEVKKKRLQDFDNKDVLMWISKDIYEHKSKDLLNWQAVSFLNLFIVIGC